MQLGTLFNRKLIIQRIFIFVIFGALVFLRLRFPPRGLDEVGIIALRDTVITILFWISFLLVAHSLGAGLIVKLRISEMKRLEEVLFALGLGLGCLGYVVLALGLVGLLNQTSIVTLLIISATLTGPRVVNKISRFPAMLLKIPDSWRSFTLQEKVFAALITVSGLFTLIFTLSPPWDYDGLMYHLVGPRIFLGAEKIIPFPDNWYVNGPFTIEMLFTVGQSFGDDIFPKLIHMTFGVMLVTSTFAAGQRWLSRKGAWIAAAVLLGLPILPFLASFAYIDLGWSVYEFLALYAAILWWIQGSNKWLILSGVFIGFGMGSKYLALEGFMLLGLFVLVGSFRRSSRHVLKTSLYFGIPALLVASPWYLKNLLWFGNPVFPFYLGAHTWDVQRLELYSAFLDSFGAGKRAIDFLLLPLNMYVKNVQFGAVMNNIDIPSLLFPLIIAYPFLARKDSRKPIAITILLLIAIARFVLWSIGSQQTRFLYPVFPALSLVVAYITIRLESLLRPKSALRQALPTLCLGLMTIPIFYQGITLLQSGNIATLLGKESKLSFLERNVTGFGDFPILQDVEVGFRTLLLGDGRSYYCSPNCIPDPEHFRWAAEIQDLDSCSELKSWANSNSISSILLNSQDLDFLLQHDPSGTLSRSLETLRIAEDNGCLRQTRKSEFISLYEVLPSSR